MKNNPTEAIWPNEAMIRRWDVGAESGCCTVDGEWVQRLAAALLKNVRREKNVWSRRTKGSLCCVVVQERRSGRKLVLRMWRPAPILCKKKFCTIVDLKTK